MASRRSSVIRRSSSWACTGVAAATRLVTVATSISADKSNRILPPIISAYLQRPLKRTVFLFLILDFLLSLFGLAENKSCRSQAGGVSGIPETVEPARAPGPILRKITCHRLPSLSLRKSESRAIAVIRMPSTTSPGFTIKVSPLSFSKIAQAWSLNSNPATRRLPTRATVVVVAPPGRNPPATMPTGGKLTSSSGGVGCGCGSNERKGSGRVGSVGPLPI